MTETLESLCDQLGTIRDDRLGLARRVAARKDEEKALEQRISQVFDAHGLNERAGEKYRVTRSYDRVKYAGDMEAIENYIRQTGDLAALQKRVNMTHINELVEKGVDVPGIQEKVNEKWKVKKI